MNYKLKEEIHMLYIIRLYKEHQKKKRDAFTELLQHRRELLKRDMMGI